MPSIIITKEFRVSITSKSGLDDIASKLQMYNVLKQDENFQSKDIIFILNSTKNMLN